MKHLGKFLAFAMILGSFAVFGQSINTAKSTIKFKTKGAKGSLGDLKGKVHFDESNLSESTFNVTVNPNTINTGVAKRDEHLKNPDFFETSTYPEIKFSSTGSKKEGDKYVTEGTIEMHGSKQKAKILFTYDSASKTFTGTMSINPSEFKIGDGSKYDGVKVDIVCVIK